MTSLRKPDVFEEWVALLRGQLSPEEAGALLEVPGSSFRMRLIPGTEIERVRAPDGLPDGMSVAEMARLPLASPLTAVRIYPERDFRAWLTDQYDDETVELYDAAYVLVSSELRSIRFTDDEGEHA